MGWEFSEPCWVAEMILLGVISGIDIRARQRPILTQQDLFPGFKMPQIVLQVLIVQNQAQNPRNREQTCDHRRGSLGLVHHSTCRAGKEFFSKIAGKFCQNKFGGVHVDGLIWLFPWRTLVANVLQHSRIPPTAARNPFGVHQQNQPKTSQFNIDIRTTIPFLHRPPERQSHT